MLKGLTIENFAIIDQLNLEFENGLNIFTGETGAGKTIIIEALSLVLGERADTSLVRTGEEKSIISAFFDISGEEQLKKSLGAIVDLKDEEILLKREISASGKGSCYLNKNLISLNMMKEIGNVLVDIHGQHEHQSLLNTGRHIDLLDNFGGIYELQKKITKIFNEIKTKEKRLEELSNLEKDAENLKELLQFQLDEIRSAQLKEGEDEKIEKERIFLSNAQKIFETISGIYNELYETEGALIDRLKKIGSQLKPISLFDEEIKKFLSDAEGLSLSLQELASQLRRYRDSIQFDPQKLELLTERQDLIQRLKKKYGGTISNALKISQDLEKKLKEISSNKEELKKLEEELKRLRENSLLEAKELSEKRRAIAKKLEKRVEEELSELEMKKTKFSVEIKSKDELGPKGIDEVEFLLSPNPGEELRPLTKIASGGEISRIMLAIKAILADVDDIPIMIFDEIDIGIGGKTATRVGDKLKKLAAKKQILCITHLPQIARCGNLHFKVEKSMEKNRTKVSVNTLEGEKRIEEIARMISGDKITSTSLKHARELLET